LERENNGCPLASGRLDPLVAKFIVPLKWDPEKLIKITNFTFVCSKFKPVWESEKIADF